MSVSMWRMNESGRMGLTLLLCAALLLNGGVCQDDATVDPATVTVAGDDAAAQAELTAIPTDAAGTAAAGDGDVSGATAGPTADAPAGADDTASLATAGPDAAGNTAAPAGDGDASFTVVTNIALPGADATDAPGGPDVRALPPGTSGPTAGAPPAAGETQAAPIAATQPPAPETNAAPEAAVIITSAPLHPVVVCVPEAAMKDRGAVKVELQQNSDCERTKAKLEGLPAAWCPALPCTLEVYQEANSNTLLVASPNAAIKRLEETLGSTAIKSELGVSKTEARPEKGSAVFVSVLIMGLLLAAGLIGGFCLKNRRGHSSKGMRLAEESYPADEENQGNTLVSVAPLTPPEVQEKPAVNGESPEAAKTPLPTNGHSTAKTADTEM